MPTRRRVTRHTLLFSLTFVPPLPTRGGSAVGNALGSYSATPGSNSIHTRMRFLSTLYRGGRFLYWTTTTTITTVFHGMGHLRLPPFKAVLVFKHCFSLCSQPMILALVVVSQICINEVYCLCPTILGVIMRERSDRTIVWSFSVHRVRVFVKFA